MDWLSIAAFLQATGLNGTQLARPAPVFSDAYFEARRVYDRCLIAAAERIASDERDIHTRYALFARECISERSDLIDAFIAANEPHGDQHHAEVRWGLFEQASSIANDRTALRLRILDPMLPQE